MSFSGVNLAARPFVNQTPLKRLSVVLWVLALGLSVVTAGLYWSYFAGEAEETRGELREVTKRIHELDGELAGLERELGSADVAAMNAQVAFLNHRIARRTFGWSRLFEDLAEVLPADVRFERLSPQVQREESGGPRRVALRIDGAARRDDALLELIDNLFRHPRFRDPNPSSERRSDNELRFSLTVEYLPPGEPRGDGEPSGGGAGGS